MNGWRNAIGIECLCLIVSGNDADFARTLRHQGNTFGGGIGYGIAILNEIGTPDRFASVMVYDTYHLLRPNGKDEECEEE